MTKTLECNAEGFIVKCDECSNVYDVLKGASLACPACKKGLESIPKSISVVWVTKGAGMVAYYYHPNLEAVQEKAKAIQSSCPGCHVSVVTYREDK